MERSKPGNLKKLDKYFETGKDFELTQDEYERLTGGLLSNNLNYVKNKSKLARTANEKNFYIEIIPVKVSPLKILFKKKK